MSASARIFIYFIALPFWIAGFGIIASIIGIFMVKTTDNNKNENDNNDSDADELQNKLLHTIRKGIFTSTVLSWTLSFITCGIFFGFNSLICYKLLGCITIGLITGELIGICTEYVTSFAYKTTISIAKKSRIGSASVIIQGLGIGMLSTIAFVFIICIAVLGCYELFGDYGIAIAAVGMLSTLGVTLATDAFGPVADNAGGIAEMSELEAYVRDTIIQLWSLLCCSIPNVFINRQQFEVWYNKNMINNNNNNNTLNDKLKYILSPFILHRNKNDTKSIPKAIEKQYMCQLTPRQKQLYDEYIELNGSEELDLNSIYKLQQICNHPNLYEKCMNKMDVFKHDPTSQIDFICHENIIAVTRTTDATPAKDLDGHGQGHVL